MKLLFTCLCVLTIFSATAQQIPNASFESWVAGTFFVAEFPSGWTSSGLFPAVIKSADTHSGSYAMKLRVAAYGTGLGADRVGYAYSTPTSTAQPLYYTYWAKIHLSGTDNFMTSADLTNTGSTLIVSGVNYNYSYLRVADNSSVWKQVSFPMVSSGPRAYDSITLSFSFPTQLDTSSYVILDDLAFSQYPAGIADVSAGNAIESIYPNPALGLATVIYTINQSATVTLDVYDLLGNKVSSVINENQSSGKYRAEINTDGLHGGIYLVSLTVNGQAHMQKLSVQH